IAGYSAWIDNAPRLSKSQGLFREKLGILTPCQLPVVVGDSAAPLPLIAKKMRCPIDPFPIGQSNPVVPFASPVLMLKCRILRQQQAGTHRRIPLKAASTALPFQHRQSPTPVLPAPPRAL